MEDCEGNELKPGDRVESIYDPKETGTVTEGDHLIYDDEPQTEYKIIASEYLIKIQGFPK